MSALTSVIIVSHWSQATIGACLDRVLAAAGNFQVIVVDNQSGDDTLAQVRQRLDTSPANSRNASPARLKLIANDHNRGFASACNQGAAVADGDVLVFLNPDAFVAADSLARLRQVLDQCPQLGLLGCRVVDQAGRPSGPQRRREPTWRRSLMSLTGLARFEHRWPALAGIEPAGTVAAATDQAEPVDLVDAVNGALMMLPARVFHAVGGFDEGFRLHAEDLDLCRRVRDAGWQVGHAGAVEITHIGGVSSRRRPLWVQWCKTRSLWRYFRKHEPQAGALLRLVVAIGLVLRWSAAVAAALLAWPRRKR
ncbi:MAG: glycosyltransferase family 2 protein [Xanthomonadales bacterium]|nr:glycosyltransferase family 2 protein [Xanthomonadales bacterium]